MEIKSPNEIVKKSGWFVFLAGPIKGAPDWQGSMPDLKDITWINPRRENSEGFVLENQVLWETQGLRMSDIVLFWIPPEEKHIPGRDYAQTTRMELLENLSRGKKIVLGISPDIHARAYMIEKAKEYGVPVVHDSLEACIQEVKDWIGTETQRDPEFHEFFTSDTHFGSSRTLELSKRPFRDVSDMDWTMIERWNRVVHPGDTVYHLGDFGDRGFLKYLNGKIHLICGNYERKERDESGKSKLDYYQDLHTDGFASVTPEIKIIHGKEIILSHEPLLGKSARDKDEFCLFGHIHGRQMIKKFGLDVGVDCHNFTPISWNDVNFYLNAIRKGYYDGEVFS